MVLRINDSSRTALSDKYHDLQLVPTNVVLQMVDSIKGQKRYVQKGKKLLGCYYLDNSFGPIETTNSEKTDVKFISCPWERAIPQFGWVPIP